MVSPDPPASRRHFRTSILPSRGSPGLRAAGPALPASEAAPRAPAGLFILRHPPPATILWEKRKGRGDRKLLGEGITTNGGVRDTAPAEGSCALQRAPSSSPPRAPRPAARAPESPFVTSDCPCPHAPSPATGRAQTPSPSQGILPPDRPSSLPPTTSHPLALTVGDWARPSWLLRSRPPPPPLLHAPAPQSPLPPSGLAGSRSCACAARSAGALAGRARLRSPRRGRLP